MNPKSNNISINNGLKVILSSIFLAGTLFFTIDVHAQSERWTTSEGQEERPHFTQMFEPSEFAQRREGIYDFMGAQSFAVIQGAPMPLGFQAFRQNNEFYYLSGIVSPFAYLVLDGSTRKTTVYLQNRIERREYNEGKVLSAEDADYVIQISGIDAVKPVSALMDDLKAMEGSGTFTSVHTTFGPTEELGQTVSMVNRTLADYRNDPLDNRQGRHQELQANLRAHIPNLEMMNIDPAIDEMRKIKSPAEIEMIRRSTVLQGMAIAEAMRSSHVGMKAMDMEAIGRYIFWKHDVDGEGYTALTHIGPEAYMNHYYGRIRAAKDGDMLLMDYGPVYHYYTSDMARMWPVNGKFNSVQRELYTFYLEFYEAILYSIKLGMTGREIMQAAFQRFDPIYEKMTFSKDIYKKAADEFIDSYRQRMQSPLVGLGHGVGMAVHDVGNYSVPVQAGMIFVIEPQFRIPEEDIYVRLEDMILVTENGVEVISDFVPRDIEGIERLMKEPGMLLAHPFPVDWK
jgi:Xaa-Pro aminopeptidase